MSLFLLWVFWWLRRFHSYRSGLLCVVSIIVWMLVGSSVFSHPWRWRRKIIIQEKKARLNLEVIPENHFSVFPSNLPVICFSLLLFLFQCYTCFFLFVFCFSFLSDLFNVHTLQYAVFLPNTIHTLKQQEGVLSICNMPSSVLDSTVISGLQYFSHCSQFSCTVLCNFHMDVYDFICCHKNLEIL